MTFYADFNIGYKKKKITDFYVAKKKWYDFCNIPKENGSNDISEEEKESNAEKKVEWKAINKNHNRRVVRMRKLADITLQTVTYGISEMSDDVLLSMVRRNETVMARLVESEKKKWLLQTRKSHRRDNFAIDKVYMKTMMGYNNKVSFKSGASHIKATERVRKTIDDGS